VKSLLSSGRGASAKVDGGGRMSPWTLDLATLVGVGSLVDTIVLIALTVVGGTGEISAIFEEGGFCGGHWRLTHVTMDSGLGNISGGCVFRRFSLGFISTDNFHMS
jgi:hypothetical protein